MKALIFAAGRGERLRPLTDHIPKPLIEVKNKPLIQYHIEALLKAGIRDMVINVSWLHEQIIGFVTDLCKQEKFAAANIQFSVEHGSPLETGGGMLKALPLLASGRNNPEPFVVVNADIFTDFDFTKLKQLTTNHLVNLILVNNPAHNPEGDFALATVTDSSAQLLLKSTATTAYTYAGIGLYHHRLLTPPFTEPAFRIVPYIKSAIKAGLAAGQIHSGMWHDVGTIERLNDLNQW